MLRQRPSLNVEEVFREIEAATHPDLANLSEEQFESSMSMRMVLLQFLVELAHGDDSRLSNIYAQWQRHFQTKGSGETHTCEPGSQNP